MKKGGAYLVKIMVIDILNNRNQKYIIQCVIIQ